MTTTLPHTLSAESIKWVNLFNSASRVVEPHNVILHNARGCDLQPYMHPILGTLPMVQVISFRAFLRADMDNLIDYGVYYAAR